MRYSLVVSGVVLAAAIAADANAATLPEHDPIAVVVIGDEVNPNGLSDEQLTQPRDVAAAIQNPASGISVASMLSADSSCIDEAVQALENDTADVLVYFAHVAARDCSGGDAQPRLDAAVEGFLQRGGGVVVFHHGIYTAPGKEAILALFGGTANAIAWDTTTGQDVINVAPDHFVTSNEVNYAGMRAFADGGFGIPMAEYPVFNNTPDERYPGLQFIVEPGEARTILFTSDYSGAQVLGYDLHRLDWAGHVVLYQPGEYQPNALDDLDGNNFQILANAIYWVASTSEDPIDPTDDGGSSGGAEETTGDDPSDDGTTSGNASEPNPMTTTTGITEDTDTDASGAGAGAGGDGCGCRSGSGGAVAPLLLLLGLPALRTRKTVL